MASGQPLGERISSVFFENIQCNIHAKKRSERSCLRSFEAKHFCLVRNPPSAMVSFDPLVQEDLRGRNLTFLASWEFSGSYQFCGNSVSVTFKFRSTPVKCFPVLQFFSQHNDLNVLLTWLLSTECCSRQLGKETRHDPIVSISKLERKV